MTSGPGNDNGGGNGGGKSGDLADEIDRTMAEAEAAVNALDPDREDGDEGSIDLDDGDDDSGDPAVDEVTQLRDRVAALEATVEATKDKWLRALADHENYKKRVKREIDEAKMRTAKSLLPSFLSVMDNLERALEVAEPAADGASDDNAKNVQQLVEGIKMVRGEFISALAKNGIEPVVAVGHPFDPAVHDALQQFDSPDHAPGVVIREFEKGYRMGERLLRPARVIVAGAGSTGAPPPSEDEAADSSGQDVEN
jgi:molecular chaperone GrpE